MGGQGLYGLNILAAEELVSGAGSVFVMGFSLRRASLFNAEPGSAVWFVEEMSLDGFFTVGGSMRAGNQIDICSTKPGCRTHKETRWEQWNMPY